MERFENQKGHEFFMLISRCTLNTIRIEFSGRHMSNGDISVQGSLQIYATVEKDHVLIDPHFVYITSILRFVVFVSFFPPLSKLRYCEQSWVRILTL